MTVTLHHSDMLAWLSAYDGPLFDSCVTDPPYEIGFMGKGWDDTGVANRMETWRAVYDALKPGAHLVAFAATRTYHRMACAIEDAGFEIRDCLFWAYGSGFPKSHDVSKGIDKAVGAARRVVGIVNRTGKDAGCLGAFAGPSPITAPATAEAEQWQGWGTALKPSFEPVLAGSKPLTVEQHFAIVLHEITVVFAGIDLWSNSIAPDAARRFTDTLAKCDAVASIVLDGAKIRSLESIGIASNAVQSFTFKPLASLDLIRTKESSALSHVRQNGSVGSVSDQTTPSGEAGDILARILVMSTSVMTGNISGNIASLWLDISDAILFQASKFTIATASKLTTALKILNCSLRESTIAGTGHLTPNLEPICLARKPLSEKSVAANVLKHGTGAINVDGCRVGVRERPKITDAKHSGNTYRVYGKPSGGGKVLPDARWPANLVHDGSDEVLAGFPETGKMGFGEGSGSGGILAESTGRPAGPQHGDSGSAARFFYSAKAGPLDRIGTAHATVKPVDLMRWLVRLVTPPGGHILEPFAGSGTTGIAAMAEGFDCTMIELEAEHVADIERKLAFLRGEGGVGLIEKHKARLDRTKDEGHGPLFGEVAA